MEIKSQDGYDFFYRRQNTEILKALLGKTVYTDEILFNALTDDGLFVEIKGSRTEFQQNSEEFTPKGKYKIADGTLYKWTDVSPWQEVKLVGVY